MYISGKKIWGLLLFLLLIYSCDKNTNTQDTKIRTYTLKVIGLYPKIFNCIGKKELPCIYFTTEDGSVRFIPLERLGLEEAPPAFMPDQGLAVPLIFSEKITAVIQISREYTLGYRLISTGAINLDEFVHFASAKNDTLLFGNSSNIEVASESLRMQIPNDKNNIITDNQEYKTIEITGDWKSCSDINITQKGIEGIVFSNAFSGIRYFLIQKGSAFPEFIGWREFQENTTHTETGIPHIFLANLSEEAYPSVDSTEIDPPYPFGFVDTKTIWFSTQKYPPPQSIKVKFVRMLRRFESICSLASDGTKTFVFAEDKNGLYVFQRKSKWEWIEEKITDNSYGYLNSFIFGGTPCAVFTGKDGTLKITCKINNTWKIKTIDPDVFSGINLHMFQENSRLHIVYNLVQNRPVIRYVQVEMDRLFRD